MSIEFVNSEPSPEEVILRTVRMVVTQVIKDTAVKPGMLHPLSSATREDLRQCLILITQREQELAIITGRAMTERPHFKDECQQHGQHSVVVPISNIKRPQLDGES